MIRVDRTELTRKEIIRVAAKYFLKDGYSKTTFRAIGKALNMSTGNLTFHFPTKEHMLAKLVDMLCKFQWAMMEAEAQEGYNSIMAVCLELLSMASACEQNEVIKDFFLSAYTSPMTIEIIRKNDTNRAKDVFREYCSDWSEERFIEAEALASGIEYATLMATSTSVSLERRISSALELILMLYNVPEEIRKQKIAKVSAMDYRKLGQQVMNAFITFVDQETEQALQKLLARKTIQV